MIAHLPLTTTKLAMMVRTAVCDEKIIGKLVIFLEWGVLGIWARKSWIGFSKILFSEHCRGFHIQKIAAKLVMTDAPSTVWVKELGDL
ncbi:hypothetical protein C1H46_043746 [Malus baccata]|uniref:Uncharacterized protein n=1 Tax=Malus baccata TaxID=106549 RepID=A0A540K906_MALBA|nr:hypothetical protein C1H46_043746 [Malus baccata]